MKAAVLLVLLTGCFDSIVSDPCLPGYALQGNACVLAELPDAGSDGNGVAPTPDAALAPDGGGGGGGGGGNDGGGVVPDAPPCSLDLATDPDNCGSCGNVCLTGVCNAGVCLGDVVGHVVAIGHDYVHFHPVMARVIGDAVALGIHHDVAVIEWRGAADEGAVSGTGAAIASGMQQVGRPWHEVAQPTAPVDTAFDGADVVVFEAQHGDGAVLESLGVAWQAAFTRFIDRGGVAIVLEGPGTASYRFAHGAGLYDLTAAPVEIIGQLGYVTVGADAVTQQVLSPYAAFSGSVTLPGAPGAVIATAAGQAIVAHVVR